MRSLLVDTRVPRPSSLPLSSCLLFAVTLIRQFCARDIRFVLHLLGRQFTLQCSPPPPFPVPNPSLPACDVLLPSWRGRQNDALITTSCTHRHDSLTPFSSFVRFGKKCYLATIRAVAKWGRWDHVESLLDDMRQLGIGMHAPTSYTGKHHNGDGPTVVGTGELSSEWYAYLIEAYAQALLWTRAIDVYRERFVTGWDKKLLKYRVSDNNSCSIYPPYRMIVSPRVTPLPPPQRIHRCLMR